MNDVAKRLAEIEERANAASTGPWSTHDTHLIVGGHTAVVFRGPRPSDGSANELVRLTWLPTQQPDPWGEELNVWSDAAFIGHARDDVPWLIEQLRQARKAIEAIDPNKLHIAADWIEKRLPSPHTDAQDDLRRWAGLIERAQNWDGEATA